MSAEGAPQPANGAVPSADPFSYLDASELLSLTVQHPDPTVVVAHVAGELDMLTGPPLESRLMELLATRPERLIIDLSQVTFLGSTGLSVLVGTQHNAEQQTTLLQLSGTSTRAVAVPLSITGLDRVFEILPSPTGLSA